MCTPHHCHKHWLSTSLFHRLIFKIFQNCKLQTTIQWAKLLWEHNNTSSSGSGSRSNSNKTDDKLSYAPKQTSVTQLFYATFNCVILLLLLLGLFKVLLCTEVEWLPVTATKKIKLRRRSTFDRQTVFNMRANPGASFCLFSFFSQSNGKCSINFNFLNRKGMNVVPLIWTRGHRVVGTERSIELCIRMYLFNVISTWGLILWKMICSK